MVIREYRWLQYTGLYMVIDGNYLQPQLYNCNTVLSITIIFTSFTSTTQLHVYHCNTIICILKPNNLS